MKKVLFIIPSLRGGGAEKLLSDILNRYDTSKYKVHLMYFCDNNVYTSGIPKHVRQIVPFYIDKSNVTRFGWLLLKILGLRDWVFKYKIKNSVDRYYDTIVSFLEGQSLHIHNFLIGRANKNISYVHTDLRHYPISLNRESLKEYNNMDCIVFVSKNACESFRQVFPTNCSDHKVLPNFIDIAKIKLKAKDFEFTPQKPTIICIGRLEEVKGFEILIDIAKQLKNKISEFQFRIIGTGVEENKLKSLVKLNNLEDYVIFDGFKRNPYPYIANSDIMLSTSLAEGFSLVICEAMSLGIPVIASKTDGSLSLLGGGAGILVERDPSEYVNAIIKLLENPDIYNHYVSEGKRASRGYDIAPYLLQLYEIL